MLKEYLLRQGSGTGRWGHGMPGVQICRFSLPEPEQEPLRSVPVCGAPLQFEALFCLTGRLTVRALQGTSCMVEAPGFVAGGGCHGSCCMAAATGVAEDGGCCGGGAVAKGTGGCGP